MDKQTTDKPARLKFSGYQKFVIAALAFLQFSLILDLRDRLAAGRDDDAHPAHYAAAVRAGGVFRRLQRLRSSAWRRRGLHRSLRSQAPAAVLLYRLYAGHPALRPGPDLSHAADGAHRHRTVRGRDRFGGAGHRHRPVPAGNARPGDGLHPALPSAPAQVLGLPAGLYFANHWDWYASFCAILAVAMPAGSAIIALVDEAGVRRI